MKKIQLFGKWSFGKEALVSDEDYDMLSAYRWTVRRDTRCNKLLYARCGGFRNEVYMHRLVIGDKKGFVVDHINLNTLDNRRENLRHLTISENCRNRIDKSGQFKKFYRKKTSTGITQLKSGKWQSQAIVEGKYKYLGQYVSKEEASNVFKKFINSL